MEKEKEKAARQKLKQAVASPVVDTSSYLLEARENKLKHVEGQLRVLSVDLSQVKLRMANQYDAHTQQIQTLLETEERLKGEVAKYQSETEAATSAGVQLKTEVDETVRRAVASALAKERVQASSAGMPTTSDWGGPQVQLR